MALTLEEVAKLAQVSRSTVSRVINEQPNVRAAVRERVWEIIHAHDYQPHQIARMLVTGRTNMIGVIVPPVAINVFVVKNITGVPFSTIYRGVYPFLISLLAGAALLFVFPGLATWLPRVLMP